MNNDNPQADGYYNEDASAPREDFDLSFLDKDEPKE